MTIEQLQSYVDTKPDIRGLINVIVDYMQANPGSGGSQNLDQVLANGSTLTEDRTVELSGNRLNIVSGSLSMLHLGSDDFDAQLSASDNTATSIFEASGDLVGGNVYAQLFCTDGTNTVSIDAQPITNDITYTSGTHTFNGDVIINNAATGTFTSNDGKAITVVSGIITSII